MKTLRELIGIGNQVKQLPTQEKTQEERDYWQYVYSTRKPTNKRLPAPLTQVMAYEQARTHMGEIMQERAAHLSQVYGRTFKWAWTQEQKQVIQQLLEWAINDEDSSIPLQRGVFLYGSVGTGKSEIMQMLQVFCERHNENKHFEITNISEMYTDARMSKDYDMRGAITLSRCFDEFGRQSGSVMLFGNAVDVNEAIIEQRYNRMNAYGQITHFVSNATPDDIRQIISPMAFDRLRSMCTPLLMPGISHRQ